MEPPKIKPVTENERDWVAHLLASSEPWITLGVTYERTQVTCHDPEFMIFVAHIKEEPCGAIILHKRGLAGSPYVKSIAVSEKFRSFGIGAELIKFAENLFRGEAKHLFLCVSSFNTRAQAFYERIGFEAVGELKDYIIEGASEIIMHKRIL